VTRNTLGYSEEERPRPEFEGKEEVYQFIDVVFGLMTVSRKVFIMGLCG